MWVTTGHAMAPEVDGLRAPAPEVPGIVGSGSGWK